MKRATSFFDDTSSSPIYRTGDNLENLLKVKKPTLKFFSGEFYVESSPKKYVKKQFEIYQNTIIAYDSSKREGAIYLKGVRMTVIKQANEENLFEIVFSKNSQDFSIYLENYEKSLEMKRMLTKFCVLEGFISHYTLLNKLGEGNFGMVYRCERNSDKKIFAVKMFDREEFMSQNEKKVALHYEIEIMRRIDHPNIMKLYEVYEGEEHIYLILEYIKGENLMDLINKENFFTEDKIKRVIYNTLIPLQYMHSRDIIHRDIKPENIMITDLETMSLKLIDLGLSAYADPSDSYCRQQCGTPGYVAPEMYTEKFDARIDIFSLGIIFYSIVTKANPFHDRRETRMIEKNKKGNIKFNEYSYLYPLSKEAKEFLKMLCSKDPSKRPTTEVALQNSWLEGMGKSQRNSLETQPSMKACEQAEEADECSTYDFSEHRDQEEISPPRNSILKVSKSFSFE